MQECWVCLVLQSFIATAGETAKARIDLVLKLQWDCHSHISRAVKGGLEFSQIQLSREA